MKDSFVTESERHVMHEYYARKAPKLKKAMNGLLKPISGELEKHSGKLYSAVLSEICAQILYKRQITQ